LDKDVRASEVLQMLKEVRLTGPKMTSLLERALDADYWRRLNPDFEICGTREKHLLEAQSISDSEAESVAAKFRIEGYFRTAPILSAEVAEKLCISVERLRVENWPPVFSFVYDAFWSVFRTPSLEGLLSVVLGPDFKQNSLIWTYYVSPRQESAGWRPHVDAGGSERVTIWIPLTDASVDNGCINVIPRNLVPDSLPDNFMQWQGVTTNELGQLLQVSRALPADAGSLLGWHHGLIHWGSRSHGTSTTPRISIAGEFLGNPAIPHRSELPLLNRMILPTFEQRVHMIGKAIIEYAKFEPLMLVHEELAKALIAQYDVTSADSDSGTVA
jgi:Phytanoyl-CoA dioxygenase (PhyH)